MVTFGMFHMMSRIEGRGYLENKASHNESLVMMLNYHVLLIVLK